MLRKKFVNVKFALDKRSLHNSKECVKVVTRHVWADYLEMCEDIRYTIGNKEIYDMRKETIERIFGTAKEYHGFRYTQYIGKARMNMKAGLTFACMNLKKLAKMLTIREERECLASRFFNLIYGFSFQKKSGAGANAPAPTLSTF